MTKSTFTIGLHELDDGPKELTGALPRQWVAHVLKDTDVQPYGDEDGQLELVLTKNGVEVLVQGRLRAKIQTPCARTLDPAVYSIEPEVFLMLSPSGHDPAAPRARRGERSGRDNRGKKHEKSAAGWETDSELSESEAAVDTYSGDQIVLDGFLREFILLEVPMVPLREDLRNVPFEANPPLPSAGNSSEDSSDGPEKPLDPRLSPLAELKARLENKE